MTVEGACVVAVRRSQQPVRIAYELYGSGEQHVLLIMGVSASREPWRPQAEFLSAHGYQVCIFDNRGAGLSGSPSGCYTTREMAHDTIELLEHLSWTSGVHIAGVSMGGMIAMELASIRPQMVASMVLTSTHAGSLPPLKSLTLMPRYMLASDLEGRIKAQCDMLFPKAWLVAPSKVDATRTNADVASDIFKSDIANTPPQSKAGSFGQMSASTRHNMSRDHLKQLGKQGIHILVCTGDDDNLVKPSNSHYLAELLQARLEVYKGFGHALAVQDTDRYNNMLLEHFREAQSKVQVVSSSCSDS